MNNTSFFKNPASRVVLILSLLVLAATSWATSVNDEFNPSANAYVYHFAVQEDGKIVVSGNFTTIGGESRNRIARLNIDGSVDAGFNPGANASVETILLQSDGKILAAGNFTAIGGQSRNYIARLNSDGSVDTGFNPGANGFIGLMALHANGKILVAGDFTSIGGQSRNRIARLNSDGSVDMIFNPGADSIVTGIAIQADDKILVGGYFTTINGQSRSRIARLNSDGGLDTGFNPGANDNVDTFAVQPDGKILVGGRFTTIGGQSRNYIARLNYDGGVDSVFNPGANGSLLAITMQADGKILVGGNFTSFGGQSRNCLARLDIDGNMDMFFNPGPNMPLWSMAQQPDGKILLGGAFTSIGGQTRYYIARIHADGGVETIFNPGADGHVNGMAIQTNNKIVVGGNFTTLGGLTRNYIARLNTDGNVDTAYNPGANDTVFSIAAMADGKIMVGGWFTSIGGQTRNYIAKLNINGSADMDFNPGANDSIDAIAIQPDGRILVVGKFTTIGGQARNSIARLNSDGSVDAGFNPGADPDISDIAIQPDGKILVGGQFHSIGGQVRSHIARLNSDGSVDPDFHPDPNDVVESVAVQPDGKILIGGFFTMIDSQPRNRVARLNSDGSLDSGFNPGADGIILSLVLQADGKILVGGWFTTIGGQSRNYIARLNMDGTADPDFNPGANGYVYSVTIQQDGKILVGGDFTSIDGQTRNYIARLSADDAALQSLSVSAAGTSVTWLRGQSSPEIRDVTFEYSPNSISWSSLGSGTRISGGWQLTGLSLPIGVNGYIRGRGLEPEGYANASTSLLESIRLFYIPSTITVTSPNGGENWTVDDVHDITWSSTGAITNVDIEYCTETSGTIWNPVATATANDGSFSWTVPNTPSTSCRVRISDAADGDPIDQGDAVFTISLPVETISPPDTPSGPDGGLRDTSYSFSTGGSTSDLGHTVQYKIDWNDGSDSGWLAVGTTSASHTWTANGTYMVRAIARCATHTATESTWSGNHAIIISDTGTSYFNSPSNRLIITEVNWAAASGGGNWISEVQVIDLTGGSTVQAYYNSGTTRNGPFTLWTNTGVDGHNVKFSNILQTIDGLDGGPFVYYGTSGTLELVTQDAGHLIQASVRTYNGNFSRTFPALTDNAANLSLLVIPNITNSASYRPSVVLFNPSAESVSCDIVIVGGDGVQIGSTTSRTLAAKEMNVITTEVRADTYDNAWVGIEQTSASGTVMASGQTANNYTNDPAAHLAVQLFSGYPNSPDQRKLVTEVNWAAASGGGTWISEVQIIDATGGSTVQVYYNSGTTRNGPFTLWSNPGLGGFSVKFANILQTIDGLDSGPFVYYGTSGSLEFVTQDSGHRILASVRTYNGNFSRTFPALSDMADNTAALGRIMIIPNISNNATYRPSVVLFNPSADSVTCEVRIIGSDGIQIGSTIPRTLAGYEMNVITTEVRADSYDTAFVHVMVTSGSGRLLVSGQTANNYTNDPAAHLAVQGQ